MASRSFALRSSGPISGISVTATTFVLLAKNHLAGHLDALGERAMTG